MNSETYEETSSRGLLFGMQKVDSSLQFGMDFQASVFVDTSEKEIRLNVVRNSHVGF